MTDSSPFEPSRPDGRSDVEVVFQLAEGAAPDTVFTYDALIKALSDGVEDREVTTQAMRAAVYGARQRLLRETQRYLEVVRNRGYRVVSANEHLALALRRKSEAGAKWKRGRDLLEHTRLDEVPAEQRSLHLRTATAFAIVGQAIDHLHVRQERQEEALDELRQRVSRLEDTTPAE
jgi:hypothetical protein